MIGVFDSGIGGLSVLQALRRELPGHDFTYFADTAFAPYGGRDDAYIAERSRAIASTLVDRGAQALVVACNTATAAAVHLLREDYPDLPVIGIEPALKPAAAHTRTRRVGVMATRYTVGSAKLRALHDALRGEADFVLQPCDGLADAIEANDVPRIASLCRDHVSAMGRFGSGAGEIDTLVLGCTHYVFAREVLAGLVGPQVALIDTGEPVARQARRQLEARGRLRDDGTRGQLTLLGSDSLPALQAAAARWLTPQ